MFMNAVSDCLCWNNSGKQLIRNAFFSPFTYFFLSAKESYSMWMKSFFSLMLTVRLKVADPPPLSPLYSQPDRKISGFFWRLPLVCQANDGSFTETHWMRQVTVTISPWQSTKDSILIEDPVKRILLIASRSVSRSNFPKKLDAGFLGISGVNKNDPSAQVKNSSTKLNCFTRHYWTQRLML